MLSVISIKRVRHNLTKIHAQHGLVASSAVNTYDGSTWHEADLMSVLNRKELGANLNDEFCLKLSINLA